MVIKKGLGAIIKADSHSVARLRMKDGDSKLLRILTSVDEILSGWLYQMNIGDNCVNIIQSLSNDECPLARAGHKASFVSFVEIVDKDDNNKVKIWPVSKEVGLQLKNIYEKYGSINDRDFKVKMEGKEPDTKYYFFPKDKEEFISRTMEEERIDLEEYVKGMILGREELVQLMSSGKVIKNTPDSKTEHKTEYPF